MSYIRNICRIPVSSEQNRFIETNYLAFAFKLNIFIFPPAVVTRQAKFSHLLY